MRGDQEKDRMRGDGRHFLRGRIWWIETYHRGKPFPESTHSTDERDAKKLLRKRMSERMTGKFHGTKQERVTYEQLKGLILADYRKNDNRSTSTLRYRFAHLDPAFAGFYAVDITPARLHQYQADRRAAEAGPATINKEQACLRRMFSLAAELQLLAVVPVFPKKLDEPEPRTETYEHAQYLAIRAHLHPDYVDLVDGYYETGQRKAAFAGIQWPELKLERNELWVDGGRVKGKKTHAMGLTPELRAVFLRRVAARRLDLPYIFHHNGKKIGDWRKAWATACKAAGLPGKRLHDFKRTMARDQRAAGNTEKQAMGYLGNRTASIYRGYEQWGPGEKQAVAAKLSEYRATLPTTLNPTVVPIKRAEGAS